MVLARGMLPELLKSQAKLKLSVWYEEYAL